jgi:hypothetical protein
MAEEFRDGRFVLSTFINGSQTALQVAERAGNRELVGLLLNRGADASIEPLRSDRIVEFPHIYDS